MQEYWQEYLQKYLQNYLQDYLLAEFFNLISRYSNSHRLIGERFVNDPSPEDCRSIVDSLYFRGKDRE